MNNLYSLSSEYKFLLTQIEDAGGELTPEIEQRLSDLEYDITTKAGSIIYIKDRFEHDAKYWRERARAMAKVASSLENAASRLKENLKLAMNRTGIIELRDGETKIQLNNSAPKLVITDESKIPKLYMMQTVTIEPDTGMIKEALKTGASVPGAELQPVQALRVYLNNLP